MSLRNDLADLFGAAFAALGLDPAFGEIVPSQRPDLGQFQCNGAMPAAKVAGRNPREIATEIIDFVKTDERIANLDLAGPGFINIGVTDTFLAESISAIDADPMLGVEPVGGSDHWILDFGGPNVAKELHVGHLRTAIIGESFKRILRFSGKKVTADVHLGDWGVPMGQLIVEVRNQQPDLPYFDEDYAGPYSEDPPVSIEDLQELYPISSAKMKSDPEYVASAKAATVALQNGRPGYRALWQHFRDVSVAAIKTVYDELDVTFDVWLGESSVHDRIDPLVSQLVTEQIAVPSEGAVVIHVTDEDADHQIPPLMLVKSDGGFAYATTDLATVAERVEDLGGTGAIYFVDARQSLHFDQVFRAARKAGIVEDEFLLEHAKIGTVNGLDGTPLKTRDGGLPLLRELLADVEDIAVKSMDAKGLAADYPEEERTQIARLVGIAAVKFGDLSNHRTSSYIFDLHRFSSFEGKTGPYLLYVAVRIASLLRKASEVGFSPGPLLPPSSDTERALMLKISEFGDAVDRATALRAPNHVAEYCYELSGAFNRFYEECHILTESDESRRDSWLALANLTRRVVVTALDLLGISVPERM